MDTFRWATDVDTKGLIEHVGTQYAPDIVRTGLGRPLDRVLDVGSGASEEIVRLFPGAREYVFLDAFTLPAARPGYRLLQQPAGAPFPIDSGSIDLASTNGSFDHFTDAERLQAFLEVERCLKPGGRFLFACEYFDFDPAEEAAFFHACATHPEAVAMHCPAYSNIDLRSLVGGLTSLRVLESRLERLPDGRPLRAFVSPDEARYYRSHADTLEAWWGAFFVVFEKDPA